MPISASRLRADIYRILDQILETGRPLEIERSGRRLKIVPVEPVLRLGSLSKHPGAVVGDPSDLVHTDWSAEWKP